MKTIQLLKMLDSHHEGSTYCLQLQTLGRKTILDFQENELQNLQEEIEKIHPGKVMYFASTMQYLG